MASDRAAAAEAPDAPGTRATVVIPAGDRVAQLSACLESLALQDHPDFEVIVVDDCSSDGTAEYLREFGTSRPGLRLRVLRNERPRGANPSRNRGVCTATGALVAFLDSDCIAEP